MTNLLEKKIRREAKRNGYLFDDMANAVKAMQHQALEQYTEAAMYRERVKSDDPELWRIAGDCIQFSKDVGAIS